MSRRRRAFATPERRKIQQLSFPDRAAADKALVALKAAASFEDGLKALGLKDSDIELGALTKRDMIDAKIADAAFKLEKGQLSDVVQGTFANVILRVTEIAPGKQSTFEEVKDRLHDRIAGERAGRALQDLHDRVDDARAGGGSLKEIAGKLNVPFMEIEATDKQGLTPDGKPALENPDAAKVLASAFVGGGGLDREAVELGSGGYAWVDVAGVTAERQKPFEEVQDAVKAAWIEAEKRTALNTAAQAIVDRVNKGDGARGHRQGAEPRGQARPARERSEQTEGLTRPAVQRALLARPRHRSGGRNRRWEVAHHYRRPRRRRSAAADQRAAGRPAQGPRAPAPKRCDRRRTLTLSRRASASVSTRPSTAARWGLRRGSSFPRSRTPTRFGRICAANPGPPLMSRSPAPPVEVEPSFGRFRRAPTAEGAPQVVWTRLVADLETPVSADAQARPMAGR